MKIFVWLLFCSVVHIAMGQQQPCPANSAIAATEDDFNYCVCNAGYTCYPEGVGFCGSFMNDSRIGFPNTCVFCACSGILVFKPSVIILNSTTHFGDGYCF